MPQCLTENLTDTSLLEKVIVMKTRIEHPPHHLSHYHKKIYLHLPIIRYSSSNCKSYTLFTKQNIQ